MAVDVLEVPIYSLFNLVWSCLSSLGLFFKYNFQKPDIATSLKHWTYTALKISSINIVTFFYLFFSLTLAAVFHRSLPSPVAEMSESAPLLPRAPETHVRDHPWLLTVTYWPNGSQSFSELLMLHGLKSTRDSSPAFVWFYLDTLQRSLESPSSLSSRTSKRIPNGISYSNFQPSRSSCYGHGTFFWLLVMSPMKHTYIISSLKCD